MQKYTHLVLPVPQQQDIMGRVRTDEGMPNSRHVVCWRRCKNTAEKTILIIRLLIIGSLFVLLAAFRLALLLAPFPVHRPVSTEAAL